MKRHKSVLQLYVRSSFHWLIAVCVLLAGAEFFWFRHTFQKLLKQYEAGEIFVLLPERVVEMAHLEYFFLAALALVTVILLLNGRNISSKQEYTLYRLGIQQKYVFLWQAIYGSLSYLLLWAVQVAAAVGLCMYFVKTADSSMMTNQTLFLAFCRNEFLSFVLPVHNVLGGVAHISMYLALGWSVAYETYCHRRGKRSFWLWIVVGVGYAAVAGGATASLFFFVLAIGVISFFTLKEGEWTLDGE